MKTTHATHAAVTHATAPQAQQVNGPEAVDAFSTLVQALSAANQNTDKPTEEIKNSTDAVVETAQTQSATRTASPPEMKRAVKTESREVKSKESPLVESGENTATATDPALALAAIVDALPQPASVSGDETGDTASPSVEGTAALPAQPPMAADADPLLADAADAMPAQTGMAEAAAATAAPATVKSAKPSRATNSSEAEDTAPPASVKAASAPTERAAPALPQHTGQNPEHHSHSDASATPAEYKAPSPDSVKRDADQFAQTVAQAPQANTAPETAKSAPQLVSSSDNTISVIGPMGAASPAAPASNVPSIALTSHNPALAASAIAQVNVVLQQAGLARSASSLTVQLDPAELGRVEIKLKIEKDKPVQASIMADRPQTLDILRSDRGALERALQSAGLDTNSGSLSFNLRGDGDANRQTGNNSPFARQSNVSAASTDTTNLHLDVIAASAVATASGRLDLRV